MIEEVIKDKIIRVRFDTQEELAGTFCRFKLVSQLEKIFKHYYKDGK